MPDSPKVRLFVYFSLAEISRERQQNQRAEQGVKPPPPLPHAEQIIALQAMRPEVLLVANLNDPVYLDFVCSGSVARLPARFSEHWPLARTIRHERQQPKRDHPLPTSKQAIRHPNMLANLKELLDTLIRLTAEKPAA